MALKILMARQDHFRSFLGFVGCSQYAVGSTYQKWAQKVSPKLTHVHWDKD